MRHARNSARWRGVQSAASKEIEMVAQGGPEDSERGKRASFDPKSGEVHGSGSGAGGGGNPREDYDSDSMAGAGSKPPGAPRPIYEAIERPIDADEGN